MRDQDACSPQVSARVQQNSRQNRSPQDLGLCTDADRHATQTCSTHDWLSAPDCLQSTTDHYLTARQTSPADQTPDRESRPSVPNLYLMIMGSRSMGRGKTTGRLNVHLYRVESVNWPMTDSNHVIVVWLASSHLQEKHSRLRDMHSNQKTMVSRMVNKHSNQCSSLHQTDNIISPTSLDRLPATLSNNCLLLSVIFDYFPIIW